ncbi:hypothetical protein ATEIFO6365_0003021300 [Aspergillus terreus]|uniref:Uncharacterized protein n=1 Tax=Aspergillus terreus TaxID=33178 RepID=A0A5M3YQZ4_ASPTE|nr:hypothetical protein ATETN484_0003015200 [Aspergillus terreus]GFF14160.1 hypothetical protein ATEIFO6365_0003021300 [Aspergillus terreus]
MKLHLLLYALLNFPLTLASMSPATVVSALGSVQTDLINLSRFVLNYGSPDVNNTHIADSIKRLENHAASAIEHIPQLDVLDTNISDTVTETAVQVANAVSRYLDDVAGMKSTKQRQYDHTMRENMQRFRHQIMRIGTGIQTKVQPDYVRRINESYLHVDQEFDKAMK